MGNTVSAHICHIKVFNQWEILLVEKKLFPTADLRSLTNSPFKILLRLDPSIYWWKKIGVPRNDQIWRTRW